MAYQDILVHVRPYGSIEPVEVALRLGGRLGERCERKREGGESGIANGGLHDFSQKTIYLRCVAASMAATVCSTMTSAAL